MPRKVSDAGVGTDKKRKQGEEFGGVLSLFKPQSAAANLATAEKEAAHLAELKNLVHTGINTASSSTASVKRRMGSVRRKNKKLLADFLLHMPSDG